MISYFFFKNFCCIPYNKSKCESEWAGGEKYVGHVVCKPKLACSAAALPRGSCGGLDQACFWDLPSPYSPHTHVVVVTKGRAFPPPRWSLTSFHHQTKPLQPAHGQVQAPLSGARCVSNCVLLCLFLYLWLSSKWRFLKLCSEDVFVIWANSGLSFVSPLGK